MANLVSFENVCLAYGLDALLDQVKLQIESGERVCLIGRNGAGKSSILKIIMGSISPDQGIVWRKPSLKLACLSQNLPRDSELTVFEYVAQGLADIGSLLSEFYKLTHQLTHTEQHLNRLARLQQSIENINGWQYEHIIQEILQRLSLPKDALLHTLSGGWQRRAALAQALVSNPDLLLLDEPTNHLDIDAIIWLESYLLANKTTLLFVTHDRALLKRLATRIIELDAGKLTSWQCDYDTFLQRKFALHEASQEHEAAFEKKLAQEERWIRQGIKARRTRNEGRVRALHRLREMYASRRRQIESPQFDLNQAKQSGDLVIQADNVSFDYHAQPIIKNFTGRVMRGDKIGLIGPNGIGKTTFINLLLGNLSPQKGTITQGTRLQIAYFDQLRHQLDLEKNVVENVIEGSEFIEINGKQQHIYQYLMDFLFTPARARTPIKALSGGESNRLLLAKLFSKPFNFLVMDEPTNDLDIETLELLEEKLNQYTGTLILISHDRTFLEAVVTHILAFKGNGIIESYAGGYQAWQALNAEKNHIIQPKKEESKKIKNNSLKKLSYKDQKELDDLPTKIEKLETELEHFTVMISGPDFYQQERKFITESLCRFEEIKVELKEAYDRWEKLELLQQEFNHIKANLSK